MDKIHFLLDKNKVYYALITKEENNVIKIIFDNNRPLDDILASGFEILNENNNLTMSDDYYYNYNTIYRNIDENTVLLSNDGSVYIETETTENTDVVNNYILTDEEKLALEKQNKICELENHIKSLKNKLLDSDYVVIKYQEYLLVGKEIPTEYDIISYNKQRDFIRQQINDLQLELETLQ